MTAIKERRIGKAEIIRLQKSAAGSAYNARLYRERIMADPVRNADEIGWFGIWSNMAASDHRRMMAALEHFISNGGKPFYRSEAGIK